MKRPFFLTLLVLLTLSAPLHAAAGSWQNDGEAAARLVSAKTATGDETELSLGLELRLEKGWHTYWRSPGPAGLAPVLDASASDNLEKIDLLFPAPERFGAPPLEAIGYEGNVLFPLNVTLKDKGKPLALKTRLDLLICNDICLPKKFDLALSLPFGPARASADGAAIEKALRRVPQNPSKAGMRVTHAHLEERTLILELEGTEPLRAPDLFVETGHDVFFGKPAVTLSAGGTRARLTATATDWPEGVAASDLEVTATIVDGDLALEQKLDLRGRGASPLSFGFVLLLALAGGFILNLMPCVLPVLSLKVFGLMRHGGRERRAVRRAFLSSAAGILFSFMLLAGAMALLRATGQAFGWGVQFQQPLFLIFMIVLLTFFAANLWGFFDLGMVRAVRALIDPARHPKLAGDFATGALATLLATPCSAPFLGTAVGFALAAGLVEIFAVFFALGLGMALPYLMIAARPSVAAALPPPGPWMLTLSRILGLGLGGTALWLLVVLAAQVGVVGAALAGFGVFVLWALFAPRFRAAAPKWLFLVLCVFVLSGILAVGFFAHTPSGTKTGPWRAFDRNILETLLREGKTVFVDVTADWCLTCKANKRFALSHEEVERALFETEGIVAMQADWTNPDPELTAFLRAHERFGIPFTIVFGPRAPNGIILPELLTPSVILKGIQKAAPSPSKCPLDLPKGASC